MDPSELDALLAAADLSPDNLPLRRHAAIVLLRAGLPDDAEMHVRAALALSPGDPTLGGAMGELLRGRPEHALAHLLGRAEAGAPDPFPEPGLVAGPGASMPAEERLPPAPPRVVLDDVAGMEEAKRELRLRIVAPFTHPELHAAYGRRTGGGVLLYGPPGCGKTLLARAAAGELGARFLAVGIDEILDMWTGVSERNMHGVFDEARRLAPSVLFFDEVDALGPRRGDIPAASGGRSLVNQFLAEMDGVATSNEGVLVMAASNAPWHLDAAFRRPGRFDRLVFVPPPDGPARRRILEMALAGRPSADVDLDALAAATDGLSGADLVDLVDRAAQDRFAAALESGAVEPITGADLAAARTRVRGSAAEWLRAAEDLAREDRTAGQWDDVLRHRERR